MQKFLKQDQKILYHQAQLEILMAGRKQDQRVAEKQAVDYVTDLLQRAFVRDGLISGNATWVAEGAWHQVISKSGSTCQTRVMVNFDNPGEARVRVLFREGVNPTMSMTLGLDKLSNPQKLNSALIDFAASFS